MFRHHTRRMIKCKPENHSFENEVLKKSEEEWILVNKTNANYLTKPKFLDMF